MKQQQDWRLIFADTEEIYPITDCLDELVGANFGRGRVAEWHLLSMTITICRLGGLPVFKDEVRLRKFQTGPELGKASIAQRIADEEESSDTECSRCPGDDQQCKCFHEGRQKRKRQRGFRRSSLCSLRDGLRPICHAVLCEGSPCPMPAPACWLPVWCSLRGGPGADCKPALAGSASPARLLIALRSSKHLCLRLSLACDGSVSE